MEMSARAAPIADLVGVAFALVFFAFWLYLMIVVPEGFMRFCVRYFMFFRTPEERERRCKRSDHLAYWYLGTTGDSKKDARIRRFQLAYARGLGIAAVVAVLGMILFAIMHALLD